MGRTKSQPGVRCKEKGYRGSDVVRWGTWEAKDGTRTKYRCKPKGSDKAHYFSVLTRPTGEPTVPVLVETQPSCRRASSRSCAAMRFGFMSRSLS